MELHDFLSRLHVEHGPNGSGEYQCRCPAHDDGTASLCVREGQNQKGEHCLFVKCQAGCNTEAVMAALGLKMSDLYLQARVTAISQGKQPQAKQKCRAKGGIGQFVCSYPYTDEGGTLLFEACRYQQDNGKKTFRLRQPDASAADGWRYTKEGVRLVLYRLPEVLKAVEAGQAVFVVEGEKDCDNMAKLGYTATTSPMGAGKWHSGDYAASLTGAQLYIIPDNDNVGRKHAQTVAHSTYKLAKGVRILDLVAACPQLGEHGDINDFFKLLGKAEGEKALARLMAEADPYIGDALAERDEAAAYYAKAYGGYCIDNGCICVETQDGPKRLANFVALPREVVTRDDGVNTIKDMLIDGWTQDGTPLPTVRIKANQFQGMGWTYRYDQGGNLLEKKRYAYTAEADLSGLTPEQSIAYAYGDTNWKDKLTAYDGKPISYDAIGNPLSYDGWTYTWKAGRMLDSMTKAGINAQFTYDHTGLRVKKTVNGVDTLYTRNGKHITHLRKGNTQMHFYYDAQGRPSMMRYNGVDYAYQHNLQGDITGIVDMNGQTVVEYSYDPWGKPLGVLAVSVAAHTMGRDNPFRYRGYVYDEETGLYVTTTRYYDPEWGRFLNADTLLGEAGALLSHNIFTYCLNDPVNLCDPDGKIAEIAVLGAWALAALGYVAGSIGIAVLGSWLGNQAGTALAPPRTDTSVVLPIPGVGPMPQVTPGPTSQTATTTTLLPVPLVRTLPQIRRRRVVFPVNPIHFSPLGLEKRPYPGSNNGSFIKWFIPGTKTAVFEWNEDSNYGAHYHIRELGPIHFWPGMPVPEPYASIYFPY